VIGDAKRAEVMGSIKDAVDKAGVLVMTALGVAAAALLIAGVALVIAVRSTHASA
jgi:hypothetical protein